MSNKNLPIFIQERRDGTRRVVPHLLAKAAIDFYHLQIVRESKSSRARVFAWYPEGYYQLVGGEVLRALIRDVIYRTDPSLISFPVIQEAEKLVRESLEDIKEEELNRYEHLINVENGMVLVTPQCVSLMDHDDSFLSTIQLPLRFLEEEAPTPTMDAFLEDLSDGDPEVRQLLWEVVGVICSNYSIKHFKQCPVLVGKGNTGKSVFFELMMRMVGERNSSVIDMERLEKKFGTNDLYQKRLCGCADMSCREIGELKTFKQVTGGDPIFAEAKGLPGYSFRYGGMLLYCCNQLPQFGGDHGEWVYHRFLPIPCDRVIPPEKQNKFLIPMLMEEKDAIFRKGLTALQGVIGRGFAFTEPAAVRARRNEYRLTDSPCAAFVTECMAEKGQPGACRLDYVISQVYQVYKRWSLDSGINYLSRRLFREGVAEALGTTGSKVLVKKEAGMCFRDRTLTEEAVRLYLRER